MTATPKAPTPRIVRTSNEPVRLDRGERAHVGVDVHKLTDHVAIVRARRCRITTSVQPASPAVLLERLGPIRTRVAQVVPEAGPTGLARARRLRADGSPAQVLAPAKARGAVGPEARSDRLDGRRPAGRAQTGRLWPVRVPTEPEEADR